ncbi:MAG: sterol desaturase family protein [Cyclobacteriaceae bacterium]|jgi:alkylglycerol monooxygenase
MTFNYVAVAIPAFFIFLGLEYLAAIRQKNQHFFKFDSSVANLTIGIAERLLNLFITTSFYGAFVYVYEHFALWQIPNTWWVWVILLLTTDLVWYWYHRLGHEINLFWAAHIVHHQSEEFNYTVAARITTFQAIIRNVFWCLLPLAGFHPTMVFATLVIHGAYSFFTHTQLIKNLGWLEYIFITPSLHGVHHASNEKYINKNYGDLFVFWDKVFGTFQKEEEETKPVYGLTHPLKSYSFMWQHFHYFLELNYAIRRTDGWLNKAKLLFGKPEYLNQQIRPALERIYLPHKQELKPTVRFKVYLIIQLVAAVLLLFFVSGFFFSLNTVDKTVNSLIILVTIVNCGALLEQRRWIYYLEYIRILLIIFYFSFWIGSIQLFLLSLAVLLVVNITLPTKKLYLKFVYDSSN